MGVSPTDLDSPQVGEKKTSKHDLGLGAGRDRTESLAVTCLHDSSKRAFRSSTEDGGLGEI